MDRLTSDNDDLSFLIQHLNTKTNFDGNKIKAMHEKLKAYESLNLSPDEARKIIYGGVPEWIPKYLEYRKLEVEGRLIKPPCAVGDTVYYKTDNKTIMESEVYGVELRGELLVLTKNKNKHGYINYHWFRNLDIGKTVFLTREEAERELKGAEK